MTLSETMSNLKQQTCSATVDHPEGGFAIVVWATLGERTRMKLLLAAAKHAGSSELTNKRTSWTGNIN